MSSGESKESTRILRSLIGESTAHKEIGSLVLLHGRGSGPEDLAALAEPMRMNGFRVVSLQAPLQSPSGGWMWYRFAQGGPNKDDFRSSLDAIDRFIKSDRDSGRMPLILVGFSQGATMSMAYATERPAPLKGVVAFSGFLVDGSRLPGPLTALHDFDILLVHGRRDQAIAFESATFAESRLKEAGAKVSLIAHNGYHQIPQEAWNRAMEWAQALASGRRRGNP